MIKLRQRKLTFALLALIVIFAGCKAETPTTPTANVPGGTPSGGVTPPTNAVIDLSASPTTNPQVNQNVTITAKVTQNGSNVPNGTAVQFTVNGPANFTDSVTGNPQLAVKTTTNGVATAILTSSSAGTFTVTAVVNNVQKSITVQFSTQPTMVTPPSTAPTITAVTPSTGKPQGGDTVTISGTNFIQPVRVLFDLGNGTVKEGFVCATCVTNTTITVVTPAINLTTGQTQAADVIVLTQAGTAGEQRVTKAAGFTFAAAVLTPAIRALQPTSGPISGGTRVTILGDAFQFPVQVFFGSAEAQLISTTFDTIVVLSPRASDTTPSGSGVVTGPVDVKVTNVNSNKSTTFSGGFRYVPKMVITTVTPTSGPFTGGTRITIDGAGFDDPLAVVVSGAGGAGGSAAQVIRVSATEVVAITSAVQATGCGDISGAIQVTNTENGDSATGPVFTFRVPKPLIISITPNPAPIGGMVSIRVLNAFGFARITIGGVAANIVSQTDNGDQTTTFVVTVPATITLGTVSCPAGGAAQAPTAFDVTYTSATTGCSDTSPKGLTVNPPVAPALTTAPIAFNVFTATITQNVAPAPPFPGTAVTPSSPQTLQIINTGTSALNITGISTVGASCGDFVFGPAIPPAAAVTLNECESLPVTVNFKGNATPPINPTTETCTLTITTNAGTKNILLVGTQQ